MNLIDKLPYFYDNPITKPIQDSFSIENNLLNEAIDDLLNQCISVDNATTCLPYWESMLSVSNITNLDIEARRENVKARMRTKGTSTIAFMKKICESYSNGEVDIIVDSANYSFVIKFVGSLGIPKAFNELHKTINEIKPCHLAHTYEFTYMTWNEFDTYNKTWDTWDTLNLTWNQFEIYREGV